MPNLTNEQKYMILGIIAVLIIGCSVIAYQKYSYSPGTDAEIQLTKPATTEAVDDYILVHITGAVRRQGVYRIRSGERIYELVMLAGGLADGSNIESVNFASVLTDGQKVNIPCLNKQGGVAKSSDQKVNINTADEAGLDSIPGIGKTTAQKIVQLRQKKGCFSDILELKELSGFSDKKIAKLAPYITLN